MAPDALIARLRTARDFRVPVEFKGQKCTLVVRRPYESNMGRFRHIDAATAASCVVGWHDVTEETILGAGVGATDQVPFDRDLATELVLDRGEWAEAIAKALAKSITAHVEAKGEAAKN